MTDIRSMTLEELKEAMTALGEKPFRAKQIYEWLHVRLVDDFDEMTNLSRALREKLRENYALWPLQALRVQTSKIDGTKKFLFALSDRQVVESVWMQYHHGDSVCISSQVGCRMGCKFCASGIGGLVRNLTVGESWPRCRLSRSSRGTGVQCGRHGHGRTLRQLRHSHPVPADAH